MHLHKSGLVAKPLSDQLSFQSGGLAAKDTLIAAVWPFFDAVGKAMMNGIVMDVMNYIRQVAI